MTDHDPVLNRIAAAKYCGISKYTLDRKRKRGDVEYIQLTDRLIGHRQSHLDKMLARLTMKEARS